MAILCKEFIEQGYDFIGGEHYLSTEEEYLSFQKLQAYYKNSLEKDGPRKRAYLKLEWDLVQHQIKIAQNQSYFQTSKNNNVDGGKIRQFKMMDTDILKLDIMKRLIQVNISLISEYAPLANNQKLIIGLHFIQYCSEKSQACYSSPVGLHIDDEPLVFVHLVHLSPQSLGGDNLIARLDNQEITNVIRLERPMETIVLNNNCYHAVTPLGSRENVSIRDIILFTVEPDVTQIMAA